MEATTTHRLERWRQKVGVPRAQEQKHPDRGQNQRGPILGGGGGKETQHRLDTESMGGQGLLLPSSRLWPVLPLLSQLEGPWGGRLESASCRVSPVQ